MKVFAVLMIITVAFFVWLQGWVTSGEMDLFIQQKADAQYTPIVLKTIAQACFDMNKFEPANHYLRWLVKDYPDDKDITKSRFQLGKSYEELGQKEMAMEQYVILKDKFLDTEYGKMGESRFKKLKY